MLFQDMDQLLALPYADIPMLIRCFVKHYESQSLLNNTVGCIHRLNQNREISTSNEQ